MQPGYDDCLQWGMMDYKVGHFVFAVWCATTANFMLGVHGIAACHGHEEKWNIIMTARIEILSLFTHREFDVSQAKLRYLIPGVSSENYPFPLLRILL